MLSRLGAFTIALLLAATTAGCGSDAKPESGPKPAASASTTPTPSAPPTAPPGLVATKPERPVEADTPASAVEYGYHLAKLVEYSLRSRDASSVQAEAFDPAACSVCRKLSKAVRQMRKEGGWQITPDLRLGTFRATRSSGGYSVVGNFVFPNGRFVRLDGSKIDVATGGKYLFDADLRWDRAGSRWQVLDFTFDRT